MSGNGDRLIFDPQQSLPATLAELQASGWRSLSVKREIYDNFLTALARGDEIFSGLIGYEQTVIPELNIALLAQHDLLFLGEKGQGKSRLMRTFPGFSIPWFLTWTFPVARYMRTRLTRSH